MTIRPLAAGEAAVLAARLAELPLLRRYRRQAADLARDLDGASARGEVVLVHDAGADGPDGLAWFSPSGTFLLGGYLKLLAVAPGAEGRGIGRELLAAFEAEVGRVSRHAFLLVSDFNQGAQRFYERHGFARVGALPDLVLAGVSEVVYWKRLG